MQRGHLIIGGLGFLGSEMTKSLRELAGNARIAVVDPNWFGAPVPDWLEVVKPDAWDLVAADLEGFDSVTMLSGLAGNQMVTEFPRASFRDNLALPTYVAWLARSAGVRRFLFSSTTSIYECDDERTWTEDMAPAPRIPPSVTKFQVERALECWGSPDFNIYIFRLGSVCGWSPRPRLDLVINAMCRSAVLDGRIRVNGAGIWRSTLSVRNAGEVFARGCLARNLAPGTYNVVEGAYTLGQLGETVRAEAAKLGLSVTIDVHGSGTDRHFRVDGTRLKRQMPEVCWEDAAEIARTILAEIRDWDATRFADERYNNFAAYASGREREPK